MSKLSLHPATFELFRAFITTIPALQAHLEIRAPDFSVFFLVQQSPSVLSSSQPRRAPRWITWTLLPWATPSSPCHCISMATRKLQAWIKARQLILYLHTSTTEHSGWKISNNAEPTYSSKLQFLIPIRLSTLNTAYWTLFKNLHRAHNVPGTILDTYKYELAEPSQ